MKKLIEQKEEIEKLRTKLNDLIKKKGDLMDSEIIRVSGHLDEHIAEYYRLLKLNQDSKENL